MTVFAVSIRFDLAPVGCLACAIVKFILDNVIDIRLCHCRFLTHNSYLPSLDIEQCFTVYNPACPDTSPCSWHLLKSLLLLSFIHVRAVPDSEPLRALDAWVVSVYELVVLTTHLACDGGHIT